jgi:hypothetical protein
MGKKKEELVEVEKKSGMPRWAVVLVGAVLIASILICGGLVSGPVQNFGVWASRTFGFGEASASQTSFISEDSQAEALQEAVDAAENSRQGAGTTGQQDEAQPVTSETNVSEPPEINADQNQQTALRLTGGTDFYDHEIDLTNPLGRPYFVEDWDEWMSMTPEERESVVSEALGIRVWELGDETGVAYAFNADGIDLTDLPLFAWVTYHVHLKDGRIVFFMDDAGNLSDYDQETGDSTVRIVYPLAGEVDANGNYCMWYYNAVKNDTETGRTPIGLGYFAEYCKDGALYASEPTMVETFHWLLDVTGADLTEMGERDGVWYFRSSLGSQDVTCPENWVCYGTSDPANGEQMFTEFTGSVSELTGAYLFDTADDDLNDDLLSDSYIVRFLRDYRINTQ